MSAQRHNRTLQFGLHLGAVFLPPELELIVASMLEVERTNKAIVGARSNGITANSGTMG